jgi:hypothetical protein
VRQANPVWDNPNDLLQRLLANDPIVTLRRMIDDKLTPLEGRLRAEIKTATTEAEAKRRRLSPELELKLDRIAEVAPVIGLFGLLLLGLTPPVILYNGMRTTSNPWWYALTNGPPLLAVSTFAILGFTIGAILWSVRRGGKAN